MENMSTTISNYFYQNPLLSNFGQIQYFDTPIFEFEKNGVKYLQYELIGLGEEHIKVETEYVSFEQGTFINVTGKYVDENTGFDNEINIYLWVDTTLYDKYDYIIKNGVLTIMLYEKECIKSKLERKKSSDDNIGARASKAFSELDNAIKKFEERKD